MRPAGRDSPISTPSEFFSANGGVVPDRGRASSSLLGSTPETAVKAVEEVRLIGSLRRVRRDETQRENERLWVKKEELQ
jgi:hypothetical protein